MQSMTEGRADLKSCTVFETDTSFATFLPLIQVRRTVNLVSQLQRQSFSKVAEIRNSVLLLIS
jgi:hypothetical protein